MLRTILVLCLSLLTLPATAGTCDRSAFYARWPVEGDMDLRQRIFLERAIGPVITYVAKSGLTRVSQGTWRDELTGIVYRAKNPNAFLDDIADEEARLGTDEGSEYLSIDHVIPINWACQHGAADWSEDKRFAFATDPDLLLITLNRVNSQKGDSGPESWMPIDPVIACDYTTLFLNGLLKYRFDLTDTLWLTLLHNQRDACARAAAS